MPENIHGTALQRLQCLVGLCVFVGLAWLIGRWRTRGTERGPFPWRLLIWGLALQFIFAAVVLWSPMLLFYVSKAIAALLDYTRHGARLVFGNLADGSVPVTGAAPDGSNIPVTVPGPGGSPLAAYAETGGLIAFFVLPTIIFFSALTAILYHIGIMQLVVQGLAWVMSKTMKTSGAETLSAAANIFVGQTEAPLMVKPFLAAATRSELMCIMVAGFANIASGVLGLYTIWLEPFIAQAGGHLAAACFISAPAALLVSKLMVPEVTAPETAGGVSFSVQRSDVNLLDAATRGTTEGLTLAINVGAMLLAFTALIALLNGLMGHAIPGLTLQKLLSYPMAPIAWLSGCSWADSPEVGSLIGVKTALNELIAYSDMRAGFAANPAYISPRSALLALYALCGFANFASIGIQVGGIATIAPSRRADLSRLGLLAMLGGAISSHMTAAVVGVLV